MDILTIIKFAQETGGTAVDLGGLGLTSLPEEIGQLTAVEQLSLRGNQLTSLPAEIGHLTNLRQLSLADNQLTSLPASLGQLRQLTHLNLRNNQLTQLPAELITLHQLEMLQLQGNPLPLPAEILAKWNQPAAILEHYRTHCLTLPADAPADPNTLLWLLTDWFSEEAFTQLCTDLTLPPGTITGDTRAAQAQSLLNFHETHGLADEFAKLLRIIQQTHRASYE